MLVELQTGRAKNSARCRYAFTMRLIAPVFEPRLPADHAWKIDANRAVIFGRIRRGRARPRNGSKPARSAFKEQPHAGRAEFFALPGPQFAPSPFRPFAVSPSLLCPGLFLFLKIDEGLQSIGGGVSHCPHGQTIGCPAVYIESFLLKGGIGEL